MNWLYRVNIRDEWEAAKDGKLPLPELGCIIADRVKAVYQEPDDELEELIDELEDFEGDCDDFDNVMDRLWDWADDRLVWIGVI